MHALIHIFFKERLVFLFGAVFSVSSLLTRGCSFTLQSLADMKSINLFGVQQICRNSIGLEQVTNVVLAISYTQTHTHTCILFLYRCIT